MTESKHQTHPVDDLGEATALLTLGFHLIKMEQSSNNKYKIFHFEDSHPQLNIDGVVDEYQRKKLNVNAYAFYNHMKEIKHKIFEFNEKNGLSKNFSNG